MTDRTRALDPDEAGDRHRHYPSRPLVGVGAVVVTADRRVVLVTRRHPPLAGRWSLPGGAVELGETLEAAVRREVAEETGLTVTVGPVVEVLDRIHYDAAGRVAYHFVLVDYLCTPCGGTLAPGTDAGAVALADPAELPSYELEPTTLRVIHRALGPLSGSPSTTR